MRPSGWRTSAPSLARQPLTEETLKGAPAPTARPRFRPGRDARPDGGLADLAEVTETQSTLLAEAGGRTPPCGR
ncbi:MAG: hypothetical protein MZW92_15315 [Comamonadaceae bacterium]|nr:hypothetical protein [Comamonadaceae bacterium]